MSNVIKKTETEASKIEQTGTFNQEIDMFEKVELMGNLTSAVRSKELETLIKDLPGGEKIYHLLVKAVHNEIQVIMGKSDKDVKDMSVNVQAMAAAMSNFVQLVNKFNDSKFMAVMTLIAQKVTGGAASAPTNNHPEGYRDPYPEYGQNQSPEPIYDGGGRRVLRESGIS